MSRPPNEEFIDKLCQAIVDAHIDYEYGECLHCDVKQTWSDEKRTTVINHKPDCIVLQAQQWLDNL